MDGQSFVPHYKLISDRISLVVFNNYISIELQSKVKPFACKLKRLQKQTDWKTRIIECDCVQAKAWLSEWEERTNKLWNYSCKRTDHHTNTHARKVQQQHCMCFSSFVSYASTHTSIDTDAAWCKPQLRRSSTSATIDWTAYFGFSDIFLRVQAQHILY